MFSSQATVRHCALSLVGEPIMYPRINELVGELHRRKSLSPRPAADQSNGLSDESDGADSMSDDASFIHGDDDLDSNGTLSPIPSRSTTPLFYDAAVDPSTPRSLTPILYESVLDPEATPTHFRPVVEPSASARKGGTTPR